jgi:hypothetical protein
VSLDAWEERTLKSIAENLAASAPELASRLSVFDRLTSGERMPEDSRAKAEGRPGHHRARPRRRPGHDRAGRMQGPLMHAPDEGAYPVATLVTILAVTIAVLIALSLVPGTASGPPPGTQQAGLCAQTWPLPCNGR